jgi:hypothetical protein
MAALLFTSSPQFSKSAFRLTRVTNQTGTQSHTPRISPPDRGQNELPRREQQGQEPEQLLEQVPVRLKVGLREQSPDLVEVEIFLHLLLIGLLLLHLLLLELELLLLLLLICRKLSQ